MTTTSDLNARFDGLDMSTKGQKQERSFGSCKKEVQNWVQNVWDVGQGKQEIQSEEKLVQNSEGKAEKREGNKLENESGTKEPVDFRDTNLELVRDVCHFLFLF